MNMKTLATATLAAAAFVGVTAIAAAPANAVELSSDSAQQVSASTDYTHDHIANLRAQYTSGGSGSKYSGPGIMFSGDVIQGEVTSSWLITAYDANGNPIPGNPDRSISSSHMRVPAIVQRVSEDGWMARGDMLKAVTVKLVERTDPTNTYTVTVER